MAELSDNHRGQISRFVSFFKGKRERYGELIRERRDDTKSDRLNDDLYNHEDVESHMDFLAEELSEMSKDELMKVTQISAAYIVELLYQAERHRIELSADISIVEDEKRLSEVNDLANNPSWKPPPMKRSTLSALNSEGPDVQSLQEIQDLNEEKRVMQDRYQTMQKQLSQLLAERQTLSEELEIVKTNFKNYKRHTEDDTDSKNNNVIHQLHDAQGLLARKKEECEMMKSDLNKRLNDSSQFQDMKNIVVKKNSVIKDLRTRLSRYEPDDGEMYVSD